MSTAGEIIQSAFEDAGLCSIGQVVTAAQTARALIRLKNIINLWATQGLKVWLQQDVGIPLVAFKPSYVLSPTGDVVMTRPLQVLQGYYLTSQGIQQPLVPLSRNEYMMLSQVNNFGAISSYFSDKQATSVTIFPWNIPDATAATGTLHILVRAACPTPIASLDTLAFPPEWTIAPQWELCAQISSGQPQEIRSEAVKFAGAYRQALEAFDVEDAPTFFQPDNRTGYGRQSFR